jgi:predicted unusual protein kinase regulating ubiquinone biosynthesis (AarF/ABC1/UbiB family)/CubicO group peptidase (beta-lactamase class C family)
MSAAGSADGQQEQQEQERVDAAARSAVALDRVGWAAVLAAGAASSALLPPLLRAAARSPSQAAFVAASAMTVAALGRRVIAGWGRRLRAFFAVGTVLLGLRAIRAATASMADDSPESEALWDDANRKYARFLVSHVLQLKGLWTKLGQYLGSRADIVPAPYIAELSRLTDSMPADAPETVRAEVERELGGADIVKQLFSSVDYERTIGSAYIAQVHRAKLATPAIVREPRVENGRTTWVERRVSDVVLKVQHPGVASIMRQDLWSLDVIVRFVAWVEPAYDFRRVLSEWSRESGKELDFTREALVTRHIGHVSAAAGLRVRVPAVIGLDALRMAHPDGRAAADVAPHKQRIARAAADVADVSGDAPAAALATAHLLVLEFVEGGRATADLNAIDAATGGDRAGLLRRVTEAYAVFLHVSGVFSGDPHAGNVLVDGAGVVSLIDFGLCKVLPPSMRLAFASMVSATEAADGGALLDAFDAMGLQLNRESPGDDLSNMRYFLRDVAPPAEARARLLAQRANMKAQRPRLARTKRNTVKLPVESWPSDLLLYMRSGEILRGMGGALQVRVPWISAMSRASRAAIRADRTPALARLAAHAAASPASSAERLGGHEAHLAWISAVAASMLTDDEDRARIAAAPPLSHLPLSFVLARPLPPSEVAAALRHLLDSLAAAGHVTGIQVVVHRAGESMPLLDVAYGSRGALDPRPITPATLFNSFSVTKGVVTATLHAAMDELSRVGDEGVGYETRLSVLWPEYASRVVLPEGAGETVKALAAAKGRTTLRHVLTHSTGLQHAIPVSVTMDRVSSLTYMIGAMEEALPVWEPGAASAYSYYTFGWIAAGVLRALQARLAAADDGWRAWGAESPTFSVGRLMRRLIASRLGPQAEAEMHIGVPEALIEAGELAALCAAVPGAAGASGGGPGAVPVSADLLRSLLSGQRQGGAGLPAPEPGAGPTPESLREADSAAFRALLTSMEDKAYLFDPRLYNRGQLRRGEIPAANGHFSARSLACFYAALGRGTLVTEARLREALAGTGPVIRMLEQERGMVWGLGWQVWRDGEGKTATFGHNGAGGSLAYFCARSDCGVAVTVNQLGDRSVTRAVLALLVSHLGVSDAPEGRGVV